MGLEGILDNLESGIALFLFVLHEFELFGQAQMPGLGQGDSIPQSLKLLGQFLFFPFTGSSLSRVRVCDFSLSEATDFSASPTDFFKASSLPIRASRQPLAS